jgi:hypothetical protein
MSEFNWKSYFGDASTRVALVSPSDSEYAPFEQRGEGGGTRRQAFPFFPTFNRRKAAFGLTFSQQELSFCPAKDLSMSG